jgi:hypothetical protein
MKEVYQLTVVDIHRIAQKSNICLNSRLIYIVPKKVNEWSDGEVTLLEKYLNYSSSNAWSHNCIRWWDIGEGKEFENVTAHLTVKDIVLKFVNKDNQGKYIMKTIDVIDTVPYKNMGSRSGKRKLKKDLKSIYLRLVDWNILD